MRSTALSSSSVFVDDEMPALKNSVTKVKSSSQTSVSYYSSFSFIKINFEKNLNFKRDHEWISTFFSSVCCSLRFWVVLENPNLPRDHYPQHFFSWWNTWTSCSTKTRVSTTQSGIWNFHILFLDFHLLSELRDRLMLHSQADDSAEENEEAVMVKSEYSSAEEKAKSNPSSYAAPFYPTSNIFHTH